MIKNRAESNFKGQPDSVVFVHFFPKKEHTKVLVFLRSECSHLFGPFFTPFRGLIVLESRTMSESNKQTSRRSSALPFPLSTNLVAVVLSYSTFEEHLDQRCVSPQWALAGKSAASWAFPSATFPSVRAVLFAAKLGCRPPLHLTLDTCQDLKLMPSSFQATLQTLIILKEAGPCGGFDWTLFPGLCPVEHPLFCRQVWFQPASCF